VNTDLVEDLRPQLAPLLDEGEAPPELKAVYSSGEGSDELLVVYRLQ
jgi:hypothetical protein